MTQAPARIRRKTKKTTVREPRTAQSSASPSAFEFTEQHWKIACGILLAAAALLRFLFLTMKPMHHDEGVNGFFMTSLFREGSYHYDPANYHGPTLYYLALATTTLNSVFFGKAGLSELALRVVPAIFGIGIIWMLLCLRRYVGTVGTIGAALLCVVSPAFVYYSRYFIHEIPLIFFTLGILVAALRFYETGKTAYFMWAAASAAMVFATKETCIIIFVIVPVAAIGAWAYAGLYEWLPTWFKSMRGKRTEGDPQLWQQAGVPVVLGILVVLGVFHTAIKNSLDTQKGAILKRLAAQTDKDWFTHNQVVVLFVVLAVLLAVFLVVENKWGSRMKPAERYAVLIPSALLIFACISILFFSSFFSNPQGVRDSLKAFTIWTHTATTDDVHDTWTYVKWGSQEELAILILGAIGAVTAMIRGRNRFAIFSTFWAMGMFAAYSQIPYKTPWLILNILLPLLFTAGYFMQEVYDLYRSGLWQSIFIAMWIAAIIVSFAEMSNYGGDNWAFLWPWVTFAIIIPALVAFSYGTMLIFGLPWPRGWRLSCALIAASAIGFSLYQAIDLNFYHYDDNDNPYIYAHTVRDFKNMLSEIETIGVLNGMWDNEKKEWKTSVMVAAPEYWPMPWYFRDYPNAGYWGRLDPNNKPDQQVVIIREDVTEGFNQVEEAKTILEPNYTAFNKYNMRPGNMMILYVKNGVRLSSAGGPGHPPN